MAYTWTPEQSTGDATLDEQHKRLVHEINRLHDALKSGKGRSEIGPMLEFLASYVKDHFACEEACMEKHRCPMAMQNKAAHGKFLQDFMSLVARYEKEGPTPALAIQVRSSLGDWYIAHVMRIDTSLRATLARAA